MTFNGSGTNTIITVLNGADALTNGTLGLVLLIIVFGIVYFMLGREPTREKMVASTFVVMIVAILGGTLGIVQDQYIGVTIAAFIGALVMLFIQK